MAFVAIFLDRECGLAVVTAATGFAALHFNHRVSPAVRSGNEKPAVAITALEHFKMEFVAEQGISSKRDVPGGMAFGTVFLDRERGLAVVTTAAGRPLFHIGHSDMGVAGTRLEQLGMTVTAAEHPEMEGMAEGECTEIRYLDSNILDRMAFGTLVQTECLDLVVTVTAGFPFFHFRHGDGRILFPDNKDAVMTEGAIIAKLGQMGFMREWDRADILSFYDDIFKVLGKQQDWQTKQYGCRHQETFHIVLLEATQLICRSSLTTSRIRLGCIGFVI